MSKRIPPNALIVVADGSRATFFRNTDSGSGLTLREEQRLLPKNLRNEGPSGSRPVEQTSRQTDEATFAKQLAEAVYAMKHAGHFEKLVLVADPQTLGQFREVMHKSVGDSIVLTLAKELTNHDTGEIEDIVGRST